MHAYIQDVPIGEELYARIRANLGTAPIPGLLLHLVVRRDGGLLRYIDVWESEAACDAAFETHIHPAVAAAFREAKFRPPGGEPPRTPLEVVEFVRP
jgi:hypothetical protein